MDDPQKHIVMEGSNQSSSGATSDTLIATTWGFAANLSCTTAVINGGSVMVDPGKNLPEIVPNGKQKRITSPIGPPRGGDLGQDPGHPALWEFFVDVTAAGCQKTFYFGRLYNHTCPNSTTSTTVVIMAFVLNDTIMGTSAVQCSPTYFQHLVLVTVPPPSSLALETLVVPGTTKEFIVDGWQGMLLGINSTIQTYSSPAINTGINFNLQSNLFLGWGTATLDWQTCDCDPWFFSAGHGQTVNTTDLMNPEVLANATMKLFTKVWFDLAEQFFLIFKSSICPSLQAARWAYFYTYGAT
ncbi:hypothetical protein B0H14DRAFT_2631423 [Mycena olivaceomarginata]|nr:hypothetical protein B0H14DRAFT_2631423 [Mycena olivaceomarginata]